MSLCRSLYDFLARRAPTAIVLAALFCTLAVKLFHSLRVGLPGQYLRWINADLVVLLLIELLLAWACIRHPRKSVLRTASILAALVCTWSVMNAGWLIRTGTQILPNVLLPLFRDPLNSLGIIGINLLKMPLAACVLLGPSTIALAFFFSVLARPRFTQTSRKSFAARASLSLVVVFAAVIITPRKNPPASADIASASLRRNCHLEAVAVILGLHPASGFAKPARILPAFDQLDLTRPAGPPAKNHNLLIVVLEGIQYRQTSLADPHTDLTPYLAKLARQGIEFANTRATVTHTTKALFALLTGRFPSVSQDIAEAVPADKPYAGLPTILEHRLNCRTAFFQSAKGNFEARPGLVHNLGFDRFWARDNLTDPNAFLGYLACDEFALLEPVVNWIKSDPKPFFLTILCSVTHDPYEVPQWFAAPAHDPIDRYKQTIRYTDAFLAALDTELHKLNLQDNTILCVVGDHGEAFGEHGLLGHERIPFDEVLRVPLVIRNPSDLRPGRVLSAPVSSIDLAPTLLAMLDIDPQPFAFDGADALQPLDPNRILFFAGWMSESPAGFIRANQKFVFDPAEKTVWTCDLLSDPAELSRLTLDDALADPIAAQISDWRKNSLFRINAPRTGRKLLYNNWLIRFNNRVASAKFYP